MFRLRFGVSVICLCVRGLWFGELNTLYAEWMAESGLGVGGTFKALCIMSLCPIIGTPVTGCLWPSRGELLGVLWIE